MSPIPESQSEGSSSDINESDRPNYTLNASSSASDSDGIDAIAIGPDNYGYTALPQDPDSGPLYSTQLQDDDEDDGGGDDVELNLDAVITRELDRDGVMNAGAACQTEVDERTTDSVWNHPELQTSIPLNEENMDAIKQAMSGFNIPLVNQPQWASAIGEDSWKSQLMSQIHNRNDISPDSFSPMQGVEQFRDIERTEQFKEVQRLHEVEDKSANRLSDNETKSTLVTHCLASNTENITTETTQTRQVVVDTDTSQSDS